MELVEGTVSVGVPATSANLGPGFDCLGIALELTDTLVAEVVPEGLEVHVAGEEHALGEEGGGVDLRGQPVDGDQLRHPAILARQRRTPSGAQPASTLCSARASSPSGSSPKSLTLKNRLTVPAARRRQCQVVDPAAPKSTFSHHLKTLREAGVVRNVPDGRQRQISLRRDDLDARFPGLLDAVLHGVS